MNKEKIELVFNRVKEQLDIAVEKHPPINSPHEGAAVIKEEYDELWEAIKKNNESLSAREAEHVAAMAIRFLLDLYEYPQIL